MSALADKLSRRAAPGYDRVQAEDFRILTGAAQGQSARGDFQTGEPIALVTDLGEDPREKTFLYVNRPAPALESQDQIEARGCKWKVVARDDNEINERVKFELVKIVNGRDQ